MMKIMVMITIIKISLKNIIYDFANVNSNDDDSTNFISIDDVDYYYK